MSTLVPARFETMVRDNPFAPAVVMRRASGRDRVWNRAAVEHRATQLATLAHQIDLPQDAVVELRGGTPLDYLAAAWFLLASGRRLGGRACGAVFDDRLFAEAHQVDDHWAPHSDALPESEALCFPGLRVDHAALLDTLAEPCPDAVPSRLWSVLRALATGDPLVEEAQVLRAHAVSAA